MNLTDILFYVFAAVTLVSGGAVVFSRNVIRAAFSLLFTFFGVAGLYVLLSADFLAVTQILVYVGGILVLLVFGVMLTNRIVSVDIKTGALQTVPATVLAAMIAGALCGVFYATDWLVLDVPKDAPTTAPLGEMFLTTYLLPFEVASIVLLAALVGAAIIARRGTRSRPEEGRRV